jgi:hypothetical protein
MAAGLNASAPFAMALFKWGNAFDCLQLRSTYCWRLRNMTG